MLPRRPDYQPKVSSPRSPGFAVHSYVNQSVYRSLVRQENGDLVFGEKFELTPWFSSKSASCSVVMSHRTPWTVWLDGTIVATP